MQKTKNGQFDKLDLLLLIVAVVLVFIVGNCGLDTAYPH